MSKTALYLVALSVCLLLAQGVVFDNLVLFNCAMPFVFIYIIIALPITLGTNKSVAAGFVIGLVADAFADTYGLNALCCTILAFMRKPVFHLYVQRDEDLAGQCPTMRTMGVDTYMKYAATMVLAYCILVFVTEAFGFFNPLRLLLRIAASTAYTLVIIYTLDSMSLSRHAKRL